MKDILFLTGTRADYGKLKTLMKKVEESNEFSLNVFITGMHMLKKYGSTHSEIEKDGFENIYHYINQSGNTPMTVALSNTITGLNNYISEKEPDMIVVHGDRLEAFAGAIVGAFNNIKVGHIEGGEVSGTIDESIRHAITKLSHFHFVANEEAKKRVLQLGEDEESIFIIGSPDIDIMNSDSLPSLNKVKERYEIPFDDYSIVMYHPVTTDTKNLDSYIKTLTNTLVESRKNYVIIYPNNDQGSDIILKQYRELDNNPHFKIYPSIRFEYFLTLLRNAKSIIGNSSAGVRESIVYGIPSINIGNRQKGRVDSSNPIILNVEHDGEAIQKALAQVEILKHEPNSLFGDGNSSELFMQALSTERLWTITAQKYFVDRDNV